MPGGGQQSANTNCSSSRCKTNVEALRQSGSPRTCIPRRTRASIVAGMTSPWLHSTVRFDTVPSNSRVSSKRAPSSNASCSEIERSSISARGSNVWRQRTYGLDNKATGERALRRDARARDCAHPFFDNGLTRSSPSQSERLPALACRTRKIGTFLRY